MGDLILMADRRAARAQRRRREPGPSAEARPVTYWFDLSCPFSYLAAERVERRFPVMRWRPAFGAALLDGGPAERAEHEAAAVARAAALHMPLVWPERTTAASRGPARAALYAAEQGRAAPFVLAAGRLAFCGGFDLDDPEVLAEAASAAGLAPFDCLAAADDPHHDDVIETATSCLAAAGVRRLPALQLGTRILAGERAIGAALAGGLGDPAATHAG